MKQKIFELIKIGLLVVASISVTTPSQMGMYEPKFPK